MPKALDKQPEWTPDVGVEPVEFNKGEELRPNTIVKPSAQKLKPVDRRTKDVFVQNDWFVRENLVQNDTTYDVPQFIMGVDPQTGASSIVENPEYDARLDPNGTLRKLEMSKGPKIGANGQLLPSRYPVKSKAPKGTNDHAEASHEVITIRQDS